MSKVEHELKWCDEWKCWVSPWCQLKYFDTKKNLGFSNHWGRYIGQALCAVTRLLCVVHIGVWAEIIRWSGNIGYVQDAKSSILTQRKIEISQIIELAITASRCFVPWSTLWMMPNNEVRPKILRGDKNLIMSNSITRSKQVSCEEIFRIVKLLDWNCVFATKLFSSVWANLISKEVTYWKLKSGFVRAFWKSEVTRSK